MLNFRKREKLLQSTSMVTLEVNPYLDHVFLFQVDHYIHDQESLIVWSRRMISLFDHTLYVRIVWKPHVRRSMILKIFGYQLLGQTGYTDKSRVLLEHFPLCRNWNFKWRHFVYLVCYCYLPWAFVSFFQCKQILSDQLLLVFLFIFF